MTTKRFLLDLIDKGLDAINNGPHWENAVIDLNETSSKAAARLDLESARRLVEQAPDEPERP